MLRGNLHKTTIFIVSLQTAFAQFSLLYKVKHLMGGVTALTNDVWAEPGIHKRTLENLKYHLKILKDIPKKSRTSWKLNFITLYLLENFPNLPIPCKIVTFPEEFCFSLESGLLRVHTSVHSKENLYNIIYYLSLRGRCRKGRESG